MGPLARGSPQDLVVLRGDWEYQRIRVQPRALQSIALAVSGRAMLQALAHHAELRGGMP